MLHYQPTGTIFHYHNCTNNGDTGFRYMYTKYNLAQNGLHVY